MKLKPAVLVIAALFILAPLVVPSWILFILIKALFMFIAVLGVTMYLRGGQVTFGHALFYATGTYTVGFSVNCIRQSLQFFDIEHAMAKGHHHDGRCFRESLESLLLHLGPGTTLKCKHVFFSKRIW